MDDFLIQSQENQYVAEQDVDDPYIIKSLDTYIRNTQRSKEILVNTLLDTSLDTCLEKV